MPVLPAMVNPGTAAAAAVPRSLTTPRKALPICAGRFRRDHLAQHRRAKMSLTVLPSSVVIDFTMRGVTSLPPFAIVAMADRHLQRRHPDLVTHRNARDRNLAPGLRRTNHAADFARQFDPGSLAETEAPDVFVEFLVAQTEIASLAAPMLLDFTRISCTLSSPYGL